MAARPVKDLRLRHNGHHVGDYRTVEEVARHVGLSTLVEELPSSAPPPMCTGSRVAEPSLPASISSAKPR